MARNCLVDSKLFQTKRSGRINLRTTVNMPKALGISRENFIRNYGRYAGCVGVQVVEQEQKRGNMQEPVLLIGGQPSNNPYGAKPNQRIRYIDRNIAQMGNVAMHILQRLIMQSPVGPAKPERRPDGQPNPHYYECHILMVNGREWSPGDPEVKVTDTIQIVNTRIYARRIEQGWSMMAPGGVYKPVYRWARRMFGDSFTIRWGYRNLANVPVNKVRKYRFPKVTPGNITVATRFGLTGFGSDDTLMTTRHAAAAATYGFKQVSARFPMIELKPKTLATGIGRTGGRPRLRSVRV